MDFRLSAGDEAFRTEFIAFLKKEWAGGSGDTAPDNEEEHQRDRVFEKKLAERGWLTIAWPKEYGGAGATVVRQSIMKEECYYARAPMGGGPGGQATNLVGPAIMMHGTDEQKRRFLPPISRSEAVWCQGFSEPGAGSDLAALTTAAVRDGDNYVINGRKIWTSGAGYADWCHLLARTDPAAPKHKGISYFLIDLKHTPGISFRPIPQLTGRSGFFETILEDVVVPAENMLGRENQGWYVATSTLNFERSGVHRAGNVRREYDDFVNWFKQTPASFFPGEKRERAKRMLAQLHIEIQMAKQLAYRVSWMQDNGRVPTYEASLSKMFGTEVQQRTSVVLFNIIGMAGQHRLDDSKPLGGHIAHNYMVCVQHTIAAGSSEIQRNVIAERGLGLPKG